MSRTIARHTGSCHCGAVQFAITTDFLRVNVFCLDDFKPDGILVHATAGKGMA